MNWFTSSHHSSPITHHQKLAHDGCVIGSSRFREEIKNALKLRATPRSRGRQAGEARL